MATARSCPACGAVVTARIGRCPSCRAPSGRGLIAVGLAVALAALVAAWALIPSLRLGSGAARRPSVQVAQGGFRLSANARGTDATATIDNPNPMPVDVTVRVRGYDIMDRVFIEQTLGPYRNLPPGGPHVIRAYLDATPMKSVTFEAITVEPTDSIRP